MSIHFKRTLSDHAHMYHDQELVGRTHKLPDFSTKVPSFYVVHLFDDRRGPIRVHDSNRILEVAEQHIRTCELM